MKQIYIIVSKFHEIWSTNGLKLDRHFYPLSVNSTVYFIARLRTWRSTNRIQPKVFAKLCGTLKSEPDLQMHVENLRGSPPKNWLFSDGSHLDKTMPDDEK